MLRLIIVAGALAACSLRGAETLTLEQAIHRALADNPEAHIAAHRIAAAEGLLMQAQAAFQPKVRVQSEYLGTNQPGSVFGFAMGQSGDVAGVDLNDVPTADNWKNSATITLSLYAGGSHVAGRDAARAAVEASRHGADAVRQVLAHEVTQTYLTIRKTRDFIEAAQSSVTAFESNLKVAEKRAEAGAALKTDALDMEVRLALAREDLARAQNGATLARQALASLLGLEKGEIDAAATAPSLVVPSAEAEPQRPEIAGAESNVNEARARIKQAAAGNKPAVELFAGVEDNRGFKFDGHSSGFTAGIVARWDIWDGKLTRGRVNEAQANAAAAADAVRRERLAASLEVQQARTALREADQRLTVSAKSITLAAESVKLTRERFENGLALATQLIDAETALTAARVRRADAATARLSAIASLRRALGLPMIAK